MSKYWHDATFLLFMLHPNKWKITQANFHYLIIKTFSYSHETNFNLMKNRQLGNGFPTIRAIRFFLSMFSIYQRLQNWRSLLINIAGCSCNDFMLLQIKKKIRGKYCQIQQLLCCIRGKEEGTTLCLVLKRELKQGEVHHNCSCRSQVKLLLCQKLPTL